MRPAQRYLSFDWWDGPAQQVGPWRARALRPWFRLPWPLRWWPHTRRARDILEQGLGPLSITDHWRRPSDA
jgi:hypothetical protein